MKRQSKLIPFFLAVLDKSSRSPKIAEFLNLGFRCDETESYKSASWADAFFFSNKIEDTQFLQIGLVFHGGAIS